MLSANEVIDILEWVGDKDTLKKLPVAEQLCVNMATVKFAEDIKPIYDIHHKEVIKYDI